MAADRKAVERGEEGWRAPNVGETGPWIALAAFTVRWCGWGSILPTALHRKNGLEAVTTLLTKHVAALGNVGVEGGKLYQDRLLQTR